LRRLPVRIRLTLAFACVMAVVLAATGLYVHQRVASNLDSALNQSLRSQSAAVAALAQQSDSGLTEARLNGVIGPHGQVAQMIDARGRILDQTPGLPHRPLISPAALRRARQSGLVMDAARIPGDQSVRLAAASVPAQGQRLVIVVGQSTEQRDRALSNLTDVLLLGGPVALVLASLAGFALTGAAFRPVEAMRRRAATISASDLDSRLPPAGGNDELGRLGRTLNEMLARIHKSVQRERTFVADASHELRSPLAALRTELQLMARDRPTGDALQAATGSAIEETDRLGRLADDLLLLTRADHHRLALKTRTVASADLLRAVAERARRLASPAGPTITVSDPGATQVHADRDRLEQALDNMLSNALRYAAAEVEVTTRLREDSVELHVLDDGAGFPTDFIPHAWERFARADAARTDDGAGLGLSIVRTIAELHGGHASVANRATGGADVWITLPGERAADTEITRGPDHRPPVAFG
jgi:two-component system, OmpR family, sensor kinase